ncbi:enoyl-CoA-hydratase DpgB [Micromonospora rifamycinica]|uniref:enoyl-CoA-hydratase DpgB n=1 Tax=Micromonospora rifamycinica TaxID=291594 RepID=UPI0033D11F35
MTEGETATMSRHLELTGVSGGLALVLTVDVTRPLAELTDSVNAICEQVEKRVGRTVVVLRLDGTAAQSRVWPGEVEIRDVNRWERAVRRLERLPAANVVAASGPCGGPALDLLLAVDFRIGAPDLVLLLPVNDGHFWPGMSVYRLVQNLGVARARQIVIWGMDISVAKASELGLVDQVSEDLDDAVHTATVLMGRVSDQELAVRRQLLLEASAVEYDDALGVHLAACDRELRRLAVGAAS